MEIVRGNSREFQVTQIRKQVFYSKHQKIVDRGVACAIRAITVE